MRELRVLVVGAPQTFRAQVAQALGLPQEDVHWAPEAPNAGQLASMGTDNFDVIAISPMIAEDTALGFSEFVTVSSPATVVILVRDVVLNGILPAAMRAGVRDVVDLSAGNGHLGEALERAVNWSAILRQMTGAPDKPAAGAAETGKIITVFSSKGGTGKTFVTTSLAAALADRLDGDTALLDVDLSMGDAFTYYGEESQRPLEDILALADEEDPDRIRAAGTKLHDRLWGFGAPPDPAAQSVPADAVERLLARMTSTFAYTVADVPASYSDAVLATLDAADSVCLLASLDVVGIKHMSKGLETLLSIGVPKEKISLVLNRADSKVGIEPADVERVLKVQVDAMIPSSRLVPTALNKGRPAYLEDPDSDVGRSIGDLADKILGISRENGHEEPAKRRFFRRT